MANNIITSQNMALTIPVAGVDAGPDYANNVNASLLKIDSHNHSSGQGVPITPSGLNINSDLSFLSNNALSLRSIRFSPQSSPISGSLDLGCLYESGVDLYYNDGNGNQVRITQSGGVAGSNGSIGGLASPASATYVSANSTFVWQSAASTPASLDAGSIILRNITASSKGITISPPNALANNYSLTLPAVLPGSTSVMQLDASGNISASNTIAAGTLTIGSGGPTLTGNGTTLVTQAAYQPTTSSNAGIFATSATTVTVINAGLSSTLPIATAGITSALQIIRGNVGGSGSIIGGEGFSVSHPSTGIYTITFSSAFSDTPIIVAGCPTSGSLTIATAQGDSNSSATVHTQLSSGTLANNTFYFIAIGQR